MAHQLASKLTNSFVKGLITEATGLNFPEDACTETLNCRFGQIGEVIRRSGFNWETTHPTTNVDRNRAVVQEYVWYAVAGTGDINFVVVQVGNKILFYKVDENENLSPGLHATTLNLLTYKVSGAPNPRTEACQFASGKGFLFIVHPYCDPMYVVYDITANSFTVHTYELKIRDFEGVKDTRCDGSLLELQERPGCLSNNHHYNLWNQGWADPVLTAHDTGSGRVTDNPIDYWSARHGGYPSSCDVWWLFKDSVEAFRPQSMEGHIDIGNTPAPKGHFILTACFQDRSAVKAGEGYGTSAYSISGLEITTSGYQRPSCISFFAGRAWYAGIAAQGYSSKIYYTQILDRIDKIGFCYQQEDPTSEVASDLLESDGGVIEIQELGNAIKMFAMKDAILIFATNGIWMVSGSTNSGFNATDFEITKLASIPTLSHYSFIDLAGAPIWWNEDGIYTIGASSSNVHSGIPEVKSITDQTIKTFYDQIPLGSKRYAKGAFNPRTKEVQWLYRDGQVFNELTPSVIAPDGQTRAFTYNKVLCLNTLTGAFYPWTIGQTVDNRLLGMTCVRGIGTKSSIEAVTNISGTVVTVNPGPLTVNALITEEEDLTSTFKYLTGIQPVSGTTWAIAWSQERDDNFIDFGVTNYSSYFETGFAVHGAALNFTQINYIVTYCKSFEGSSLFLNVVWDYANSSSGHRIGRNNQVYLGQPFIDVQQSRIKLRGKGRAVQLKYFSEDGKPFHCIGWATMEGINSQP